MSFWGGLRVRDHPGHVAVGHWERVVRDTSQAFDREAEFERLVLPQRSLMMRTVWGVVRDRDLAEEAFQQALTTLWRKVPLLSRHPNPRALILRICLDAACDQLRERQRRWRRIAPLEEAQAAVAPTPGGTVVSSAIVEEVLAAVHRLKPRQATALLLRVVHEVPYRTIAQALGCSEVTARVHVLRAREKLRLWLSHLRTPSREEVPS